jgi:putative hydrolase of the HAD superfamily
MNSKLLNIASIRAIVFDLDNTLVDRDGAVRRLLGRWADEVSLEPGLLETILVVDKGGYGDRESYYRLLHQHLRQGATEEATLAAYRTELQNEIKAFPGVSSTLESLSRQFVLALLSNGDPKHQREKLRQSGLGGFFESDKILIAGDINSRKPNPAVYGKIQSMLKLPMQSILHVGDQWEADIAGPSEAGMQTCWVSGSTFEKATSPNASMVITTILELPGILEVE